jgi:glycosyltransferase involved in cell wall biosynthesis
VLFQGLERLAGRWTDYLIVINTEDALVARRQRIVPPDRVIFMPGIGVDRDLYAPERVSPAEVDRVRAELGLSAEDVLFLMIGEYISRKRQPDALRALRALPPQAHLALAGDGLLKNTLTDLAARLGIRDRVHFLGQRQDIAALVRTSRAVVLPSAQEGLPRSVMESLCLETPVIGARIRGVRELVDDQCGILVPMGDVPALSKAMDHLFHNPGIARNMGRRGRAKMSTCDIRYILQLHEQLYEQARGAQIRLNAKG